MRTNAEIIRDNVMKCPVCSEIMIRVIIPFFFNDSYYGEFEAYSCPRDSACTTEVDDKDSSIKLIKMIFFTEEASYMIDMIAKVKGDKKGLIE